MSKRKKYIEEFFSEYEANFNNGIKDARSNVKDHIQRSFSDCFIESSPLGVNCGKNDDEFLNKVKQGFDFYRGIGSKAMNIVSKEIITIDEFHAMVKIYWRYSYVKDEKPGTIDFHVTYFVRSFDNETKIFGYVSGDEQKALRERGLIPDEELVPNS
jgi:hypothetical protein